MCCCRAYRQEDYGQIVLRGHGDDMDELMDYPGVSNPAFQLAAAPIPLLKDVHFTTIPSRQLTTRRSRGSSSAITTPYLIVFADQTESHQREC
jgi:hypothetical protein